MTLLKRLRLDAGISVDRFAQAAGYSNNYILDAEAGKSTLPTAVLEKFAAILDWRGDPYALMGRVGEDE